MEIEQATIDSIARAFWRRIEPFKLNFGRELPKDLPVEFKAHMATALTLLHPWQVDPAAGEIELAKCEAQDYRRLVLEARAALQEIYANNGEDARIEAICSPLIDKLDL